MRYLSYCERCGDTLEELTEEVVEKGYPPMFRSVDWENPNLTWVEENHNCCKRCILDSWIGPKKEKPKDYRHIATKEERENRHRVNAYKRKKAQARYAKEW